jgi:hypothetical protein
MYLMVIHDSLETIRQFHCRNLPATQMAMILLHVGNIMRVVKTKKNEIGRACGTYGGGERCAEGFGGEA